MAKQLGIIKVAGTLENLTYMHTQDGYIVKKKTAISRNRLKYSEAFAATRLENSEFKTAASASSLLRQSVISLWDNENYGRIQNRLTKIFRSVLDADTVNERGSHKISNGEIHFLKGFEFNAKTELNQVIHVPYVVEFNRMEGEIIQRIPPIAVSTRISAAPNATHFQLVSAGVEINFEEGNYISDFNNSAILPLEDNTIDSLLLKNVVTAASGNILIAFLGIRFYQQVNGNYYAVKNKKFSALTITGVENNL